MAGRTVSSGPGNRYLFFWFSDGLSLSGLKNNVFGSGAVWSKYLLGYCFWFGLLSCRHEDLNYVSCFYHSRNDLRQPC